MAEPTPPTPEANAQAIAELTSRVEALEAALGDIDKIKSLIPDIESNTDMRKKAEKEAEQ